MTPINNVVSFVAGGYGPNGLLSDAWLYNWPDDQWIQLPNMLNTRFGFGCTTVIMDNGMKAILVAGTCSFLYKFLSSGIVHNRKRK